MEMNGGRTAGIWWCLTICCHTLGTLGGSTPGPCVLNPPFYAEHLLPNAVTVAEQSQLRIQAHRATANLATSTPPHGHECRHGAWPIPLYNDDSDESKHMESSDFEDGNALGPLEHLVKYHVARAPQQCAIKPCIQLRVPTAPRAKRAVWVPVKLRPKCHL